MTNHPQWGPLILAASPSPRLREAAACAAIHRPMQAPAGQALMFGGLGFEKTSRVVRSREASAGPFAGASALGRF